MGPAGVSRVSPHHSGPVRPVEVTGASSSAEGEPDGYADTLSSAPSLLSLWTGKVSDGGL